MASEKCVICGTDTKYQVNDHLDNRDNYVEGLGQLCNTCHKITKEDDVINIPKIIVENNPNDFELGGIIRKIYWRLFHRQ